jgi:hypothetical protein
MDLDTVHMDFYVRNWATKLQYEKSVAKTVYLVAMFFKSKLRMIVQCLNCFTAGARLVEKQRVRKVWEKYTRRLTQIAHRKERGKIIRFRMQYNHMGLLVLIK